MAQVMSTPPVTYKTLSTSLGTNNTQFSLCSTFKYLLLTDVLTVGSFNYLMRQTKYF